jgi:hypothetical protein
MRRCLAEKFLSKPPFKRSRVRNEEQLRNAANGLCQTEAQRQMNFPLSDASVDLWITFYGLQW